MILSAMLFVQIATSCAPGDSPQTLSAIASVESGFNTLIINDNNTATQYKPVSVDEAVNIASGLIGKGHSVDLGVMQINSKNLPALRLSVEDAFDACHSIRAGAKILRDNYQMALKTAFSRYNTGDEKKGFANGYVSKILTAAKVPDINGMSEKRRVTLEPLATERQQVEEAPRVHLVSDILHGIETPENTSLRDSGSVSLNLFSGLAVTDSNQKTATP